MPSILCHLNIYIKCQRGSDTESSAKRQVFFEMPLGHNTKYVLYGIRREVPEDLDGPFGQNTYEIRTEIRREAPENFVGPFGAKCKGNPIHDSARSAANRFYNLLMPIQRISYTKSGAKHRVLGCFCEKYKGIVCNIWREAPAICGGSFCAKPQGNPIQNPARSAREFIEGFCVSNTKGMLSIQREAQGIVECLAECKGDPIRRGKL